MVQEGLEAVPGKRVKRQSGEFTSQVMFQAVLISGRRGTFPLASIKRQVHLAHKITKRPLVRRAALAGVDGCKNSIECGPRLCVGQLRCAPVGSLSPAAPTPGACPLGLSWSANLGLPWG